MSTKTRISRYIGRSASESVFLRSDFEGFGSTSRVTRAIQELISQGKIMRIGAGVYCTTNKANDSDVPGLNIPLEKAAEQALKKLGIQAQPSKAIRDFNEGRTNQVPMRIAYEATNRRVKRKFSVGQKDIFVDSDK